MNEFTDNPTLPHFNATVPGAWGARRPPVARDMNRGTSPQPRAQEPPSRHLATDSALRSPQACGSAARFSFGTARQEAAAEESGACLQPLAVACK